RRRAPRHRPSPRSLSHRGRRARRCRSRCRRAPLAPASRRACRPPTKLPQPPAAPVGGSSSQYSFASSQKWLLPRAYRRRCAPARLGVDSFDLWLSPEANLPPGDALLPTVPAPRRLRAGRVRPFGGAPNSTIGQVEQGFFILTI